MTAPWDCVRMRLWPEGGLLPRQTPPRPPDRGWIYRGATTGKAARSFESGVYMLYMSISGFFANAACGPKAHSDTVPVSMGHSKSIQSPLGSIFSSLMGLARYTYRRVRQCFLHSESARNRFTGFQKWFPGVALILVTAFPCYANDAKLVFEVLSRAYPDAISDIRYQNEDWSINVNGKIIYWANGRLLPTKDRNLEKNFAPYQFQPYPSTMPPIRKFTPTESNRLHKAIKQRESKMIPRHAGFLEALWGMENLHKAEETVQAVEFLGKKTRVHPAIINDLRHVEEEILESAKRDPAVKSWIDQLHRVDAFVWRKIAGTASRSLHSFGISVDIIPNDYKGKEVYWRWSMIHRPDWWSISYTDRYMPPEVVINAFENKGFIWGGKWFFFDQIHFEYRPELMDEQLIDYRARPTKNFTTHKE